MIHAVPHSLQIGLLEHQVGTLAAQLSAVTVALNGQDVAKVFQLHAAAALPAASAAASPSPTAAADASPAASAGGAASAAGASTSGGSPLQQQAPSGVRRSSGSGAARPALAIRVPDADGGAVAASATSSPAATGETCCLH